MKTIGRSSASTPNRWARRASETLPLDDTAATPTTESPTGTESPAVPHPAKPAVAALPVSVLLVVAALTAAVVDRGAFYPSAQRVVGLLLAAALVSSMASGRWSWRDAWRAPVPACAALGAWAVASAVSAGHPAGARPVVALLAGVAVVVVVAARTTLGQRDTLSAAAVAIGLLCAASGWVGVAWRVPPWVTKGPWLTAATTLTYKNAGAAILVPLALLALGRQLAAPRSPVRAAATGFLLAGVVATGSRGGLLALLTGLAVLAALVGPRRLTRAITPPLLGAVVVLVGLVPSISAGTPPRPALAVAALAAALVLVGALARDGRVGTLVVAAVSTTVAVGVLVVGPLAGSVAGVTQAQIDRSLADRPNFAALALKLAATRPLSGVGPGRGTLYWTDTRGRTTSVRFAHNEYLQILAELGAIGLVLLLALLVGVARSVARGRARAPTPEVWAATVAGLSALAIHSGLDFLWHVPAVALLGALLVALSSRAPHRETQR